MENIRKKITVTHAGYTKANGVYKFTGIYNGYAAYCKGTDLELTDSFTIGKCGWNGGCALVMWSSHWGWGTGCDGRNCERSCVPVSITGLMAKVDC